MSFSGVEMASVYQNSCQDNTFTLIFPNTANMPPFFNQCKERSTLTIACPTWMHFCSLFVNGKILNVPHFAVFQLGPMIGLLKILRPRGFPTQLAHIPFPILLVCPLPLIDTKKRCTETMACYKSLRNERTRSFYHSRSWLCPQVPKISSRQLKWSNVCTITG